MRNKEVKIKYILLDNVYGMKHRKSYYPEPIIGTATAN